ncbi:MAG: zinc ribbon domain-containing protein [Promethearchaeota archaeon]
MRIFEIENKKQLKISFIAGVLWTGWIYLWFFHTRFISFHNQSLNYFETAIIWGPHYILSVFTLYSILYLPQNCHSNKLSIMYLLKICVLQFINLCAIMIDITSFEEYIFLFILILILNFIIVWKAKYTQLNLWERFKSTITLTVKNEVFIKENQIKLFIFVFSGVILLNLSGFYFNVDIVYPIFTVTQIVFSVGYLLYVSENRKKIDRFYDFLTLLILNFFNLLFKYLVWSYLKDNFYSDTPIFILVLFLEFFQIYIYYSFSSRTFLADFALNLHKKPIEFKEPLRKTNEKEQTYCPKCGNAIEQLDSSTNNENSTIFCPFCGEKIMRYELLDISEAELLIKHQKVLEQLDHKSEPRSYLP